jgi:isopentenyldiphosphate isomerase
MADESSIDERIRELAAKLPRFPDGRIDYSNADMALVVTCFVKFRDQILLLKRSAKVRTYQGKWNTVAGYLDELKSVREKALQELHEELNISEEDILSLSVGEPFEFHDAGIGKTWRVHPVLAELKRQPEIKLDWENTEFRWISFDQIHLFDTVPRLEESLRRALSL